MNKKLTHPTSTIETPTEIEKKEATLFIPSIADVFDKKLEASTIKLCADLAVRLIALLSKGDYLVLPKIAENSEHLQYIANIVYGGKVENPYETLLDQIIFLDVPNQGKSTDFAEALLQCEKINEIRKTTRLTLSTYVQGIEGYKASQKLDVKWDAISPEEMEKTKWRGDKVLFNKDCEKFGIPIIPGTQYADIEGHNSLPNVVLDIFNNGNTGLIMRKAIAGGGEGNELVYKTGDDTYKIKTTHNEEIITGRENLENHLIKWNKNNENGVVVAPFIASKENVTKDNISGVVEITEYGEIRVIFTGKELVDENSCFAGFEYNKEKHYKKTKHLEDILIKYAKERQKEGYKGLIQIDALAVTENERQENEDVNVYVTESNTGRLTAVILMMAAVAQTHSEDGKNWKDLVAKQHAEGKLQNFIGQDHQIINGIENISEVISEIQNITSQDVQEALQNMNNPPTPEYIEEKTRFDETIDLSSNSRITIAPYTFGDNNNLGIIVYEPEIQNIQLNTREAFEVISYVLQKGKKQFALQTEKTTT